mgnify:CR=1 FL=1
MPPIRPRAGGFGYSATDFKVSTNAANGGRSGASASCARTPATEACIAIEPTISTTCVSRKMRKMGMRICTDSFTPRRLSKVSKAVPARANGSFHCTQFAGRTENSASAPLTVSV